MARVIWTRPARDDLDEIRRFIARDSRRTAERVATRIMRATLRLEHFPFSGRVMPEDKRRERREIVMYPYRVLYRVNGDVVIILAVVHGARRLTDLPDA
jgi:toxin ParE1/3/4